MFLFLFQHIHHICCCTMPLEEANLTSHQQCSRLTYRKSVMLEILTLSDTTECISKNFCLQKATLY